MFVKVLIINTLKISDQLYFVIHIPRLIVNFNAR